MSFNFERLEIPDVVLIQPKVFGDPRGFFVETYKSTEFMDFGIVDTFLQDNHSKSMTKGTLRGLHYQCEPRAQSKLVRVVRGSVFDVAVDIRKGSPTYGKWVAALLSAENKQIMFVPRGFAHGFCTLEDDTEVIYKCSDVYSTEHESGIIWNDSSIGVKWPDSVPVILSDRDTEWPSLKQTEERDV